MTNELPYGLKGPIIAAGIKQTTTDPQAKDFGTFTALVTDGDYDVEALRREVSIEAAAKILSRLVRGTYNGSYCIRPVEM